ncbi:MAG: carbohydrate kinase [Tannerella sp.]|jgi:fructokinase|nr:carbohydrate kinase [Tannerella sp.]
MRKVIGIGETILDIIFQEDQPHVAVPGGSVFNGMVSLSRLGVPVTFVSKLGNDRVGEMVCRFMRENGMTTDYVDVYPEGKTPVSLAFLSERKEAEYLFYTGYPDQRLDMAYPPVNEDDIFVFGSFYALDPLIHPWILELLEYVRKQKAIVYYDPNFRKRYAHKAIHIRSTVMDNYEYADIVRGSDEDFFNLYGQTNMDAVYRDEVHYYCKTLITTHGANGVNLFTEKSRLHFDVSAVTPVCTVGAGDNFNAGVIYGLIKQGVRYRDMPGLGAEMWKEIIRSGMELSAEVCQSYTNYISIDFAEKFSQSYTARGMTL